MDMKRAVQFDDELALNTGEISDEWTEWNLSLEFVSGKFAIANRGPEQFFRRGRFMPHPLGAETASTLGRPLVLGCRENHPPPPPPPPPPPGGGGQGLQTTRAPRAPHTH